jgi:hypothetical protein
VDILFKWIQIQQSQNFSTSVVCPEWCNNFLFHWTSISRTHAQTSSVWSTACTLYPTETKIIRNWYIFVVDVLLKNPHTILYCVDFLTLSCSSQYSYCSVWRKLNNSTYIHTKLSIHVQHTFTHIDPGTNKKVSWFAHLCMQGQFKFIPCCLTVLYAVFPG